METNNNLTEQDFEEANKYFTICNFVSLFQANPKDIVSDLLQQFPKEANELRILLDGRTPSPIARLLQAYNANGE